MAFVDLAEAKAYARIEYDEDDVLIQNLIDAAEEDAKSYIRIDSLDNVPNPNMVKLAIKILVVYWYENREAISTGNSIPREMPLNVTRLLYRERTILT